MTNCFPTSRPGSSVRRPQAGAYVFLAFLICATGCRHNPNTERPYQIESLCAVDDPQFSRTVGSLFGPPIVGGNQVDTLVNGDQIFPAMLEAIRGARESINLETYIYWSGEIGNQFTDALAERARHGIKVNIIIDSVGSRELNPARCRELRSAGVKLEEYNPLRWLDVDSTARLNHRTHRKLLIVDGLVGFTGGAGIADDWLGDAQSPGHWRDTQYRIRGPVVAQMQATFTGHWMSITGQVLHGDTYFPPIPDAGTQSSQVVKSVAQGGSASIQLLFLLSFSASRKSIRLGNAYFFPDSLITQSLLDARRRGVRVQIIVPGPSTDVPIVRSASRARWGPLLAAGVEIYEYQPTMYHCKVLVVDDLWSSVGSANVDNRSFLLDAEANLNVMDAQFASEQVRVFEMDLARCQRITYEQWNHRPIGERFAEFTALLFSDWL